MKIKHTGSLIVIITIAVMVAINMAYTYSLPPRVDYSIPIPNPNNYPIVNVSTNSPNQSNGFPGNIKTPYIFNGTDRVGTPITIFINYQNVTIDKKDNTQILTNSDQDSISFVVKETNDHQETQYDGWTVVVTLITTLVALGLVSLFRWFWSVWSIEEYNPTF